MEAEIAAHHAAGVVTLVLKDGKGVHQDAAGMADRERSVAMTEDHVFWIASMTKSISVTAIMTLVDEGRLKLDEPASTWLPELKEVKLENGSAPSRPSPCAISCRTLRAWPFLRASRPTEPIP